jgi:pyruvate kinase
MRRTKIVCTIGPASGSEKVLKQLIQNGMDVARLNFSHGDYAFHRRIIRMIRRRFASAPWKAITYGSRPDALLS